MWVAEQSEQRTWQRRVLGHDSPRAFAMFLGVFVAYAVTERLSRLLVVVDLADLTGPTLIGASLRHRLPIVFLVSLLAIAAAVRQRARLLSRWDVLEHGTVLRRLTGSLLVLLVWQGALYDYNWFAGRTHLLDRMLVVVLALAAWRRPVFLLAFVVAIRIVDEQFLLPFGTSAGRNIDLLLVLALVALAAVHVVYVITGNTSSSAVLALLAAAIAAHFFIPGKGKLGIGWLTSGDPSNLALSSYTTGWLGHTDGSWARALSGWVERIAVPMKVGILALELGSVVAVVHPKLTRLWLPGVIVFHVVVFGTTGFWFAPWIVLEVGLFVVLSRRALRSWVAQNATVGRGAVAALAVVGAPVLFHPPGLAWLDAPVSYGYELEATGVGGTAYHVPLSALAPLDETLAFDRVQFSATVPASGAYGAVISTIELEVLDEIDDFDDLSAYERTLRATTASAASAAFVQAFVDSTAHRPALDWSPISVPGHFWTSREDPEYDFQEPIAELDVFLVRSIHRDGDPVYRRDLVLHVEATTGETG